MDGMRLIVQRLSNIWMDLAVRDPAASYQNTTMDYLVTPSSGTLSALPNAKEFDTLARGIAILVERMANGARRYCMRSHDGN